MYSENPDYEIGNSGLDFSKEILYDFFLQIKIDKNDDNTKKILLNYV